ncbi:zinc finger matrin-type protein [Anaeramoeba flamelloides]|uniref:Zinc finger matrin-type protein n=1 Tax=Anaeramoeba flamelloides TaxID=1746091 RepID=A0AAV7YP24_9EUKA|nr:zinc finger matrin-type protein [Anaeramoeba flamelloides]KAJ6252507.1 zinc finger matrin-type protein [Anaeramoeba flamelloides]
MTDKTLGIDNTNRRKWDKEEYEKKYQDRMREKHLKWLQSMELKKDEGKEKMPLRARKTGMNYNSLVGSKVNLENAVSKKESGGFYCSVCNRRFTDNLSFIEHKNSKYHLKRAGINTKREKISAGEVKNFLDSVIKKKRGDDLSRKRKLQKLRQEELKQLIEEKKQKSTTPTSSSTTVTSNNPEISSELITKLKNSKQLQKRIEQRQKDQKEKERSEKKKEQNETILQNDKKQQLVEAEKKKRKRNRQKQRKKEKRKKEQEKYQSTQVKAAFGFGSFGKKK